MFLYRIDPVGVGAGAVRRGFQSPETRENPPFLSQRNLPSYPRRILGVEARAGKCIVDPPISWKNAVYKTAHLSKT